METSPRVEASASGTVTWQNQSRAFTQPGRTRSLELTIANRAPQSLSLKVRR